jgi:5'-methylthioadenosine phosphorylase
MSAENQPVIGILGGSGVYDIDGLNDKRWVTIDTPFGAPSDAPAVR